jgi:hypothetical protein
LFEGTMSAMAFGARALPIMTAMALLIPRPASAQSSEQDRARARTLAIEGHEALEKHDYVTAEDRYAKADALFHAPTLVLGLAQAHVGQKKLVKARDEYQRIIAEGVIPGSLRAWSVALETAKKELAALEPRVPGVVIRVTGAESAGVVLDGETLPPGALGQRHPIDPGPHRARASAPGAQPSERTFTVAEGETQTLTFELRSDVGAVTPRPAGPAPPVPPPHQQPAADRATSPSGGGAANFPMKTVGMIAVGVGAVSLAAGAVTGGLAIREHSFLADDCPNGNCPRTRRSTLDNFHTLATVSTVGFIAGGVLAVGGVALVILAPPAQPAKTGLAPFVGPCSAGLGGAF